MLARLFSFFQSNESTFLPVHHIPKSPLSYIEFQTLLLKLYNRIKPDKPTPKKAFMALLYSGELFKNKSTLILALPDVKKPQLTLAVIENEPLLKISAEGLHIEITFEGAQLFVRYRLKSLWDKKAVHEILADVNFIIKANEIIYIDVGEQIHYSFKVQKKQSHISKHKFDQLMEQQAEYVLNYKIQFGIMSFAIRKLNTFTFYLNWPLSNNKTTELKAVFSKDDFFTPPGENSAGYSWIMSEKTLLNYFQPYKQARIKTGQFYYSLNIYETSQDKKVKPKQILKYWMTPDALFGELHTLKKGQELSGNVVLNIFQYFDAFFKIKQTFMCDVSALSLQNVHIPLRVIVAIATDKTWYESKLPRLKLFDCQKFKCSQIIDGNKHVIVNQNSIRRAVALKEVQNLNLKDLYNMLDIASQHHLKDLYHKYFNPRHSGRWALDSEAKLESDLIKINTKALVSEVYQKAKQLHSLKDLAQLANILCGDIESFDDISELNNQSVHYWLQKRIFILTHESFIWVQELSEDVQTKSPSVRRNV